MAFHQYEQEDRRLVILRLLAEDADYRINSSLIQRGLDMYAHAISRDALHTELHWLQEQGLVTLESLNSVLIVTLSHRGLDVAQGRAVVPGVKRPGPASPMRG